MSRSNGTLTMLQTVPVLMALAALLIYYPLDPQLLSGFERDPSPTPNTGHLDNGHYTRTTHNFPCVETTCEAWLYLPKAPPTNGARHPVVILAHGLGSQKDFGLHMYADRFAQHGIASFVFDYRTFGGSDGEPRHWVSPSRHLEDWQAAFKHVKSTGLGGQVDAQRIALWGTSFGGGHVLATAGQLGGNISAVVAQVPHLSGSGAILQTIQRRGLSVVLRLITAGLQDRLRQFMGLPPLYVKLIGTKGELAFMQVEASELADYFAKHPAQKLGGWHNMARASLAVEMSKYSPIKYVEDIKVPTLMISAKRDSLCPPELVHKAAKALGPLGTIIEHDCNHFEIYRGQLIQDVLDAEVAFLTKHLGV